MADKQSMSLREVVGKVMCDEHADVLRESVAVGVREVMEAEVAQLAGAGWYEHHPDRAAYRNGYREREWDTRVGTLELAIPRLRTGSYLPSFLEARRRCEQALVCVVQEAYVTTPGAPAGRTPEDRGAPPASDHAPSPPPRTPGSRPTRRSSRCG